MTFFKPRKKLRSLISLNRAKPDVCASTVDYHCICPWMILISVFISVMWYISDTHTHTQKNLLAAGDPEWDTPWEWSCLSHWCLVKDNTDEQILNYFKTVSLTESLLYNRFLLLSKTQNGFIAVTLKRDWELVRHRLTFQVVIFSSFEWQLIKKNSVSRKLEYCGKLKPFGVVL